MTTRVMVRNSVQAALLLVVLAMVLGTWLPLAHTPRAWAGHGSWTDHHVWLLEPGTSSQRSYADVGASNNTDYSHVAWGEWNRDIERQVTCWNDCGYLKTPTIYVAGDVQLWSAQCSRDGSHTLWGEWKPYIPCTATSNCDQCHTHSHWGHTHQWPP